MTMGGEKHTFRNTKWESVVFFNAAKNRARKRQNEHEGGLSKVKGLGRVSPLSTSGLGVASFVSRCQM